MDRSYDESSVPGDIQLEDDEEFVIVTDAGSARGRPFKRKRWQYGITCQLPKSCWGQGDDPSKLEDENGKDSMENFELEVKRRQQEIDELIKREKEQGEIRDELNDFMETRMAEFDMELNGIKAELKEKQDTMQEISRPARPHDDPLPEPRCLHFLESYCFHAIADVIILANVVVLILDVVNEDYRKNYKKFNSIANNVFMVWYVGELILRFALWRGSLLVGSFGRVMWNWLDFGIVISGVVELWIYPILLKIGIVTGGREMVKCMRYLRLCRLLRILKLFHAFLESDLSWAHSPKFQMLMMSVIALNCIIIGLECDSPKNPIWYYVEQALLIIFSMEITVRLKHQGCHFFYDPHDWNWNWLDFIIVTGGIIDQWMIPGMVFVHEMFDEDAHDHKTLPGNATSDSRELAGIFAYARELHGHAGGGGGWSPPPVSNTTATGHPQKHSTGQFMMMLRMARLLRILRLIRLIHSVAPLYQLIVSVVCAMQGMMWVLTLTIVMLYIFALLAVKLISHGLVFGGTAPAEVAGIFPSVPQSIFVLFQVMNGDWDMLQPLFEAWPPSKLVFMGFTVVSAWSVLSILTAVVSEKMVQKSEEHREELQEKEQACKKKFSRKTLGQLFDKREAIHREEGTLDHPGRMTETQYNDMLNDTGCMHQLEHATGLKAGDLKMLFQILSHQEEGADHYEIKKSDFVEGLVNEHEKVTEHSVMRLEKRLADLEKAVKSRVGEVLTKQESVFALKDKEREQAEKSAKLGRRLSIFNPQD